MDIFIKKLGSQESGYSGDKPNQRGKYILIPISAYSIFPHLSQRVLNDSKVIRLRVLSHEEIGLNIFYSNAKHFCSNDSEATTKHVLLSFFSSGNRY